MFEPKQFANVHMHANIERMFTQSAKTEDISFDYINLTPN